MRRTRLAIAAVGLVTIIGCGGQSAEIDRLEEQIADLQDQLATTTSSQPEPTTSTTPPQTTTTAPSLSAAQRLYCEDLTTVIAVRSPSGGTNPRPETVQFFELAESLGYLELPYTRNGWGQAVAETPRDFVSTTHIFAGALSLDVGPALILEWTTNLVRSGIGLDEAFTRVCLEAWELR